MYKIGLTFSGILVVTGVGTLLKTAIINKVMPVIGRAAFQAAMAGSYSAKDYHINFSGINTAAVFLIATGLFFGYQCYKKIRQ